jgi:predicted transcriptional regulator
MITQQDTGRYFYELSKNPTMSHLASLACTLFEMSLVEHMQVSKVGRDTSRIVGVNKQQHILAAFNVMHLNKVQAVPVLNDDGTLVGGISEESLASFEALTMPLPSQSLLY